MSTPASSAADAAAADAAEVAELRAALVQARAAAAGAQHQFTQLVNSLHEGALLTDADARIVLLNEPFCTLVGLPGPAADWVGRPLSELLAVAQEYMAEPAEFAAGTHRLRAQKTGIFADPIHMRDGRVLERDHVPVPGAPGRLLVRLRDATSRHQATAALQLLAHVPEQCPNPIFRLGPGGEVRYANPATAALHAGTADPERAAGRAEMQQLVAAALAQNVPSHATLALGDRQFDAALVPFPEAGYVNVYLTDITERIGAEKAMRQAKEEAEAAVRARENFLANMSHEIRTPLNGVLGMAAQLGKTHLDGRQQEFLDIIRSSGQHLLSVLNDVLDMAKISSGKLEFEQISFNLCDSMGKAIEPLVLQAREKGLRVSGQLLRETCPYPWVVGDPYRLNQILINLVSNALKFTPAGGELRVVGELLRETATTLRVRFSVADTGIGIAPDKQASIFEGFTQAYASTTRRFGGTGLGLRISRALVEQLGGTLTLDSAPGRGSTFAFELELPCAARGLEPAPPAAGLAASFDTGRLQGRRLLLLEDNEINRTLVRLSLEEWGVVLDEAASGPEGLALFTAHAYDAVLMDIQMPGMSGLDVTAIIRALPDPVRARVPILALTANAFRADNERYLAAGLNACLTKPYEEAAFYELLVGLLYPAAAPPPPQPLPYDLTALRRKAQGRTAFVEKIIRSFLVNMPGSMQELTAAAAAADWPRVGALVHHIKPSLEMVGVPGVAEAVACLQRRGQPDPADLNPPLPLHEAAARLLAQVQRTLLLLPREVGAGVKE